MNNTQPRWMAQTPVIIDGNASRPFAQQSYRIGQQMIRAAKIVTLIEPVLTTLLVIGLWCFAFPLQIHAQTTNGEIFGDDQQIGNAIREGIKWGRNLLFVMGVVFIGWAVMNYGTDKPSSKQIIAALGCFAFGGIVALIYSISQGTEVNFDTGFGN